MSATRRRAPHHADSPAADEQALEIVALADRISALGDTLAESGIEPDPRRPAPRG
jgi:hypothetical protein